jgi:hypothetical protein
LRQRESIQQASLETGCLLHCRAETQYQQPDGVKSHLFLSLLGSISFDQENFLHPVAVLFSKEEKQLE